MKSISEILGGMQIRLEFSFNLQAEFEEYLTKGQRAFLAMLSVIEEHLPCLVTLKNCRHASPHFHLKSVAASFQDGDGKSSC